MNTASLLSYCRQHGLLSDGATRITPLAGGVSSDIFLVETGRRRFVLKQSLAKLKVDEDWYCNTRRNVTEYRALQYAAHLFPKSVPQLLYGDADHQLFIMEYLGEGYVPWKAQLLQGHVDCGVAESVARLLATLHTKTWEDVHARQLFDTTEDFYNLRIEPYLLSTGQRHPELNEIMQGEAQRLVGTRQALVHGDWMQRISLSPPIDSLFSIGRWHGSAIQPSIRHSC